MWKILKYRSVAALIAISTVEESASLEEYCKNINSLPKSTASLLSEAINKTLRSIQTIAKLVEKPV